MWLLMFGLWSQAFPLGEVVDRVEVKEDPTKSYALYLPSNYDPERRWPVLFLFEPGARAPLPLKTFREGAEALGYILACTYDTINYREFMENAVGARAMWMDVMERFSIDDRRIYVGGMSGGARLASRIALSLKDVDGLVACGAGFWQHMGELPPFDFDVVTTIGDKDFNFLELNALAKDLDAQKKPNRMITYIGPHAWPPVEESYEALAWLSIRAHRELGVPLPDAEAMMARRLAAAETHQESGHIRLAVEDYSAILEDFEGLVELESLRAKVLTLMQQQAYQDALTVHQEALGREGRWRQDFLGRMKHGESIAENGVEKLRQLQWWRRELENLNRRREESEAQADRDAAQRVYHLVRTNIYERSIYKLREKLFAEAVFLNEVGVMMSPDAWFPYLNLARAYAGLGRQDEAVQSLETLVSKGFKNQNVLMAQEELKVLHKTEGFRAILAKLN